MNTNPIEIEVAFRFLKLDKMQAYTLQREVPGATSEIAPDKRYGVGYVPLTDNVIDEINDFYVRQMVDLNDCDIFVSTVSLAEPHIVDVPAVVNRMLKYIDCKLTYALTIGKT